VTSFYDRRKLYVSHYRFPQGESPRFPGMNRMISNEDFLFTLFLNGRNRGLTRLSVPLVVGPQNDREIRGSTVKIGALSPKVRKSPAYALSSTLNCVDIAILTSPTNLNARPYSSVEADAQIEDSCLVNSSEAKSCS
jgi:hypothetical protein